MTSSHNNIVTLLPVLLFLSGHPAPPLTSAQWPDFLFGCPTRGCSSRGSYSWPTPPPRHRPSIRWNWTEPWTQNGEPGWMSRGCSSSMTIVSCPTSSGLVSLNVTDGDEKLSINGTSHAPFLPIVDYYSNVLSSDRQGFTWVTGDYTPHWNYTANLSDSQPAFGPSISYMQTVMFVSSNVSSPHQVLTFSRFGDVLAATQLRDAVGKAKGVFVASGHPIIDYERAYVVARFVPDGATALNQTNTQQRLYAIDLTGNNTDNKIAWHFDLPNSTYEEYPGHNSGVGDGSVDAVMTMYNKTVFVNYPTQQTTYLVAVEDLGDSPKLTFQTTSAPGPLALYDLPGEICHNMSSSYPRPLWLTKRTSGPTISAVDRLTGKTLTKIVVDEVEGVTRPLGDITSDVSVACHPAHRDLEVLVFGTSDTDGQAHVVAVEAWLPPHKPRLLWAVNVSGPPRTPARSPQWTVGGQIAGVMVVKDENKLEGYGFAVSVVEHLPWVDASLVHVRMLM